MSAKKFQSEVSKSTVGVIGEHINVNGDLNINSQSIIQREIDEFNLPPLITTFRGRDNELNILTSLFFEQNCNKVAICGLPGFGKTESSKQFAKRSKTIGKINKIFWMNAETNEYLIGSFKVLGKLCNILELDEKILIKDVYEHFKGYKCLFIFDNAVCRRDITGFEPTHGHLLLVTSQERNWGDDFKTVQLETLTTESALTVLKSILCEKYNENEQYHYEQLISMVSNVPLGLQIIGGYVSHHIQNLGNQFDLSDYIESLQISQEKIMKIKIPSSIPNTYQKSIYGAVKVSLDKMANDEDEIIKDTAFEILSVCSFLNPDSYNFFGNIRSIMSISEIQFNLAVSLIANFSFVTYKSEYKTVANIRIHRLTRDILRFHFSITDQHILSKSYTKCLRYILDDYCFDVRFKLIHFNTVLKHADEYVDISFNFYKNFSPKVYDAVDKVYNTFKNILLRFATNGCAECLRRIFEDIEGGAKYIHKYDLLHKAAENRHTDVVEVLLRYVNINSVDDKGNTVMHTSARMWDLKTIKFLIENNADVCIENKYGEIPLFSFFYGACFIENIDPHKMNQISSLLQIQQKKNSVNKICESLLHAAAFACREELVRLLVVTYGLDVNGKDIYGNTPLHKFVFYLVLNPGIKYIVPTLKTFMENGASVTIKNHCKMTPLEILLNRSEKYKFNDLDLVHYFFTADETVKR